MEHNFARLLNPTGIVFPEIGSQKPNEFKADVSFDEYHSDQAAISSTGVRKILHSPRHYLADLLGMEDDADAEKDYFAFGRAAHLMLLEPAKFRETFVLMPDFGSQRVKANKEAKQSWLKDQPTGSIVLSETDHKHLVGMIESVMNHGIARNLLINGQAEMSGWFTEPETGVRCRIRPDYLSRDPDGKLHLIDFKTARDVRAGMFSYAIHQYMYHVQMAFYSLGIREIMKEQPESVTFLAVEKKPPYECCVYACDDDMLEQGQQWYMFALRTLRKCIETNQWPGVQNQAQMISLPNKSKYDTFPEFHFNE